MSLVLGLKRSRARYMYDSNSPIGYDISRLMRMIAVRICGCRLRTCCELSWVEWMTFIMKSCSCWIWSIICEIGMTVVGCKLSCLSYENSKLVPSMIVEEKRRFGFVLC